MVSEKTRTTRASPKLAEKQKKNFAGTEIAGKKLGVIGLGAIGVIGCQCSSTSGNGSTTDMTRTFLLHAAWNLSRSVKHISNVEDIYRECDYITIHVPLLDSTRKMINAEAIAMMKPTAIVLNFARDLLVDEEAMVDALAAGKVHKYVSDFPNTTTVGAKGCIVTPHLGASTAESEDNCAIMAVREIRDYLENGNIVHSVNFPDCSMGACTTAGRIRYSPPQCKRYVKPVHDCTWRCRYQYRCYGKQIQRGLCVCNA